MKQKRQDELRERAARVIPGGMYGHMSVNWRMPEGYPQFFSRADGCRLWDVDGNEYIDYMCAYGPMILGYGHPEVLAVADNQRREIDTATGPGPVMVELAEKMVAQISHADWAMFGKNGNDATTLCVTIARAETQRRIILVAQSAYHGAQPWCNYMSPGILESDHDYFGLYQYNDIESLEAAVREAGDDLAGIIVSALKHDAFVDQELPDPAFAKRARELCDETGALLILDDVRAGFRLSLDTSWSKLGVEVDLAAWGKAIANGEALAAVTGGERSRAAASSVFATGSFWFQAAPMAAAATTLDLLVEADAPTYLENIGNILRQGIYEQAQRHGRPVRQTGPVQMPLILFEGDKRSVKGNAFCASLIQQGIYMHPWHNMFLSLAHTEADIERTLEATDIAFQAVPDLPQDGA